MKYIRTRWIHTHPDEPVLIYMELDDARWPTRQVDIFADGRMGLADADRQINGGRLGDQRAPEIEEVHVDGELEVAEISAGEFERVWADAEKSH